MNSENFYWLSYLIVADSKANMIFDIYFINVKEENVTMVLIENILMYPSWEINLKHVDWNINIFYYLPNFVNRCPNLNKHPVIFSTLNTTKNIFLY